VHVPVFGKLSFAGQFLVLSLVILVGGMLTIGLWVQSAVEEAVVNRTSGVTALYVDSFVGPIVQASPGDLSTDDKRRLDQLISHTALGSQIVSFKIWSPDGEILYSPNPELVGRTFEVEEHLGRALDGEVVAEVTSLDEPENEFERQRWDTLIETYAPIRHEGSGAVVAVSEFYTLPDALADEIRSARIRGWAIVGIATVIMYLLLVGMTRAASNTIRRQQLQLEGKVTDLRTALQRNRQLQGKVGKAAARTTALNERFLRRVSADIHDGPAQDVALALLRIEDIAAAANGNGDFEDIAILRTALDSALGDLRAITHGLRSPNVEGIAPCDAAKRAVADFERISGESVVVECGDEPEPAPLPVNITVYRVVQESLANSLKHAGAARRLVRITVDDTAVDLEVRDDGIGFDPSGVSGVATLGLAGMRERVELLGGSFSVVSSQHAGTSVRARIPLAVVTVDD